MHQLNTPLAATALAAVAALVPAAAAHGATAKVSYGLDEAPKGTPQETAFYDFFPRKVTIHAGDKVKYANNSFTVLYSGPASKAPGLAVLDDQTPVAGATDAAGSPFWFNGRPSPAINPDVLAPAGDGKVHAGQRDVDHSALPLGDAKPFKLSFAKPGTYKVRDAFNPDVVNTVKVVKKGAALPSKADVRAGIAKQTTKLVKEAKRRAAVEAPANTVLVGNDSKHVGFFQFFAPSTVKVGQPLTISAGARLDDVHNAAIGPEAFMKSATEQLVAPSDAGVSLNPAIVYPSAPSVPLTFDGGAQSFVNTGVLDTKRATPLANASQITFTRPGTYHLVCNIHSNGVQGMATDITVTQ